MDWSIREAALPDYEGLCGVFAKGDALHRQALPGVYRQPDGPVRERDYIAAILADEDHVVFVAERDGQIVGAVHASVHRARDIPIMMPRRYAMIENLVVREARRRRGIGRSLIERTHRWARERGITQIELSVWEFNTGAIAFYERLGYRAASRRMWMMLKYGAGEGGA